MRNYLINFLSPFMNLHKIQGKGYIEMKIPTTKVLLSTLYDMDKNKLFCINLNNAT